MIVSVLLAIFISPLVGYLDYEPKEGDVIFQSLPMGELTKVIEGATSSAYSHTGLIVKKNNTWYVREAIVTVHDTHLYWWILRGRGDSFSVYRLKEKYQKYTKQLIKNSESFLTKPYDFFYELSDDAIYCSELIFKAYKQASGQNMGKLTTLGALNWKSYKKFILSIENKIPLDRVMITPKDLAEAEQLEEVYSNY